MKTGPLFLFIALLSGLSACSKYQMTLNETVVYTPPSLFTEFNTQDQRLKHCLDQAIEDGQHTSPATLTRLSCSHAGLSSLIGIEIFLGLQELNLSRNQLRDIQPLKHLSKLEVLLLSDNQLNQTPELLTLPALKRVTLDSNPSLDCDDLTQLQQSYLGTLKLPEQCQ